MALCVAGDQFGVGLVGFNPAQLALRIFGDACRVDDTDLIALLMQMRRQRFVLHAGCLHQHPAMWLGVLL